VVRPTGRAGAARWIGALACTLLVAAIGASSVYASAGFGIERYGLTTTEEHGSVDTQAGSHPYELTAEAVLESNAHGASADDVKGLDFELPPGLVIDPDPAAVLQNSAVGTVQVSIAGKAASATVYDLAPATGELASLGFTVEGVWVLADISLRPGGDGGMTLSVQDLPQWGLESVKLTLGGPSIGQFLTLPTSCAGPLQTTLQGESWGGEAASLSASFAQMAGCNSLPFDPSLSVASDAGEADTPSGYQVQLSMPQNESSAGLATAQLQNASVTLPAGTSLSLSATDGLTGCEEVQVGLDSSEPAVCPNSSKVGLVKIATPLLAHPFEGAMFLATPSANPLGALVGLYLVAQEPVSGVRIKLAGQIDLNPVTGQPTLKFDGLPQLPIGDIELELFGGERALLSTPATCGEATSTSELTPWSGNAPVTAFSSFEIDLGVNGTPCTEAQPFSPTLAVSSATGAGGGYDSLTLLVKRADQEQDLSQIALQLPQAIEEMFAGVPACGEPQAQQGTCPADSEIGTIAAQAGLGYDPAYLSGAVYLTGPYPPEGPDQSGAPEGLAIVLPVDPGPFELGTLVIRASVQTNPATGQLSIASDPLPTIVDGVALQLKELALQLDGNEFELDPDGCEPGTVTGTITSPQGSSVAISTEPLGASSTQCPSHGAAPVSTPEGGGISPGTAAVSLLDARIVTSSGGDARLKLRCTGTSTCHGKVTLTVRSQSKRSGKRRSGHSKATTIGTATFSIPPGKTAVVELRLNPAGRALLSADHGRLNATLTLLKSSPAPAQTHTENVRLLRATAKAGKSK
jgi:hypothetical protein